jgi:peptidoglycan/LPS O-acetylase OafA/YrhL
VKGSNRTYLAPVDHLRAFAALLVVLYHGTQILSAQLAHGRFFSPGKDWLYSNDPLATLLFEGHTGVALFMVLSGFILTVGVWGRSISYAGFMKNRLLRIYPLFLALLLVGIAIDGTFSLEAFVQTLVGLGNLSGAAHPHVVSALFWAVAVETQFYLVFPLLQRIGAVRGVTALWELLLAVVVVRALAVVAVGDYSHLQQLTYSNIVGRIDEFVLGMIAAWFFLEHRSWFRGWWKVAVSSGAMLAALWAFNQAHGYADPSWWRLVWMDVEGAGWALVILTYVTTAASLKGLVSRAVARLGEVSYSVYLIHFLVVTVVVQRHLVLEVPGWGYVRDALLTTLVVVVPVVLAVSTITYRGIERPFMKLRVRYVHPDAHPRPGAGRHADQVGDGGRSLPASALMS